MTKKELAPKIILYTFPSEESDSLLNNIVAVIDGDKAILVDTAYDDQMKLVLEDLNANGVTIERVIISHFHEDHCDGLNVLPDIPFYGGANFKETLVFEGCEDDIAKYTPTIVVDKPMAIEFGKHKLELIPFRGHSECTMLTKINEQFLQIADEVMLTNDGGLSLPWLCNGEANVKRQRQLSAWDKLKDYSDFTIIPAHGQAFDGDKLHGYLRNLEGYLNAIVESDGNIAYEDAIKNCDYPFSKSRFHENNCK